MKLKKGLEKRMYFLVAYNISPIQQAIQAGHAALEYARKYGDDKDFIDFVDNHKTWIILNGGTTNSHRALGTGILLGTLNQCAEDLSDNNIRFSWFNEPDLNDALTAICLIVDERVFNREDYPDFYDWVKEQEVFVSADDTKNWKILEDRFRKEVGKNIVFLKKLLNTKKLA